MIPGWIPSNGSHSRLFRSISISSSSSNNSSSGSSSSGSSSNSSSNNNSSSSSSSSHGQEATPTALARRQDRRTAP
jgi:hypothetical protein